MADIADMLQRAQDRISDLKEERQELLEANRRLVELVGAAEAVLDELDADAKDDLKEQFDIRSHEYSFEEGWRPEEVVHQEALDLRPGVDVEEIDDQLQEIRDTLRGIRKYKNREEG